MSTRDLINAIAAGDAIEIENAFNSVMAEKVSARIDDMRIDVAQNLFAEQAEEIEEETELTLEDYSLEEIQDYMMSEDFEQLDEVSKETLKSYIKKASTDAGTDALKMIRRHKGDTVKTGRVEAGKNFRNIGKQRSAGISKALDKLTKEVKEIEEAMGPEKFHSSGDFDYWHHDVTHKGKKVGMVKQNHHDAPDYGHPGAKKSWSFTHDASGHDSESAEKSSYYKTKEDAHRALINHHKKHEASQQNK